MQFWGIFSLTKNQNIVTPTTKETQPKSAAPLGSTDLLELILKDLRCVEPWGFFT